MMAELQTKVEKYESKLADYEQRGRQATDGPQRAFYEVFVRYYSSLATDIRQIIEKRKAA